MPKLSDHQLSISVINECALSGKPFTLSTIESEILRRDGILRVDICVPVREYFRNMIDQGYFQKVGDTPEPNSESLYSPSESFLLLAELVPHCVANGLKLDTYAVILELGYLRDNKTLRNNTTL